MRITVDEIKLLMSEGRNICLNEDFTLKGITLIRKGKALSNNDIRRLENSRHRELDVLLTDQFTVDPKIKSAVSRAIHNTLSKHRYYRGLKKKENIEKLIQNIFPHNDYVSYVLQHMHHRSKQLFTHSVHVGIFSLILDLAIQKSCDSGHINALRQEQIFYGALLHDIGYLKIDNSLWEKKRGEIDYQEPALRNHPAIGYDILIKDQNKHKFHNEIPNIVLHHEERLDRSGFPSGLQKEAIDPFAQIVGLCNEFEHLVSNSLGLSHRSYLDMARYLTKSQSFDKAQINLLLEEFSHLG
ncbi:MAG: HD domain-containing protein [Spirochaetota bacterium]|nr:HD domain-containing protein [Spirochaetota bacterium]